MEITPNLAYKFTTNDELLLIISRPTSEQSNRHFVDIEFKQSFSRINSLKQELYKRDVFTNPFPSSDEEWNNRHPSSKSNGMSFYAIRNDETEYMVGSTRFLIKEKHEYKSLEIYYL